MRLSTCILIFLLLAFHLNISAQDEGTLTKKARVTKGKSVYFFGGPSFQFGKMRGDYSGGLNLEAGYLIRLNRILSIGPSLSFSKFDYDKSISDSYADSAAEGNNVFIDFYEIKIVYLKGGDLKLFTAGFNFKFDFIPDAEGRKFRAYGLAKPFVLVSSRSEVSARVEPWGDVELDNDRSDWYRTDEDQFIDSSTPGYSRWAAETEFSGGLNLGVGAEYNLSPGLSVLLQSVVQMTLPITHINTSEFEPSIPDGYYHPNYPFVKKGFTAMNISVGVAYRF